MSPSFRVLSHAAACYDGGKRVPVYDFGMTSVGSIIASLLAALAGVTGILALLWSNLRGEANGFIPFYRIILGLALAPVAGMFGTLIIHIWAAAHSRVPYQPILDVSIGILFSALLFGGTLGTLLALPVTLLVLPGVRTWLPGRNLSAFITLLVSGAAFGFLSPIIILGYGFGNRGWSNQEIMFFALVGCLSGFVIAIVYFLMTRGARRVSHRI